MTDRLSTCRKLTQQLLREIRCERNLTQETVAARLGQPQSYVSKYETGERRVDLAETMLICGALETSPTDFLNTLLKRLPDETVVRLNRGKNP